MKQEAIALYRGNVQRTGEYEAVGVPDLHGIAWQFQTGGTVDLTPVVADGIVLVVSRTDRTLDALDALTGEHRWHCPISYFGDTPPHVADDVVYVSDDGSILALDLHTGQRLWTWSANDLPSGEQLLELHVNEETDEYALAMAYGPERSEYSDYVAWEGDEKAEYAAPISYRDKLYVVSDCIVMALDLATRQPVWWQFMWERVSGSSLILANDRMYFTAACNNNDDALYGLDSATGLNTFFSLDSTTVKPDLYDDFWNLGAFTLRDGIFYAIGYLYPGTNHFFDYAIGEDRFFTSEAIGYFGEKNDTIVMLEQAEGLAVGPDMVYVTTHAINPAVIALNRESRQVIWQRSDLIATSSSIRFPTLAGSVLYLILDGQICCALDAATGQERWRIPLEAGIVALPCIAGEMIFVAAGQSVYALR